MTIEPGFGRSVVRGAGLALGVAVVALVILVGVAAIQCLVLMFIAVILASGLQPIIDWLARPPPDRSRPDDPHRLRAVPRDRRRPGRRRRADGSRPGAADRCVRCPPSLDQARTWAADARAGRGLAGP